MQRAYSESFMYAWRIIDKYVQVMQRACSGSFMYGELTDKSTIGKHVKKHID